MRRRQPPPGPSPHAAPTPRPARGPSLWRRRSPSTAARPPPPPRLVIDATCHQFRKYLLGRQFHRRHRPGTGDRSHQLGATADHAYPVFQRQRSGHHRCRGLAHRVADYGAWPHPVGPHRGGQRDLHGEQRRLDPIDAGHRLGCRDRLGYREPGLPGDQRFELPRRSQRTPVRLASSAAPIAAHCDPCPENIHTGPRSSWPTAA